MKPETAIPAIDIEPDEWQIVRSILRRHVPHYEVWVFGSRAKRESRRFSDLDLAIITAKRLSLALIAELKEEFSESELPWRVDVIDWATTSDAFRKVIEESKVIVQKA